MTQRPPRPPRRLALSQDDLDALARITWAEARGEPASGQLAVADTILNRATGVAGFPASIQGVIMQRNQFEPVRSRDWRDLPTPPPEFSTSLQDAVAQRASGKRADASNGALFFLNPTITSRRGTHFATGLSPTASHGAHQFFNATSRNPRPIEVPAHTIELTPATRASQALFDSASSRSPQLTEPDAVAGGSNTPTRQYDQWGNAMLPQAPQPAPTSQPVNHPFARNLAGQAYATTSRVRPGVTLDGLSAPTQSLLQSLLSANIVPELEITSGYRSPTHNANVGGARASQHTHGNALDISSTNWTNDQRAAFLAYEGAGHQPKICCMVDLALTDVELGRHPQEGGVGLHEWPRCPSQR